MHIENMKSMMECLCTKAKSQIDGNIENVDAEELGEVIDMIKDLNEGLYYARITKSMEEGEKQDEVLRNIGTDTARYYNDYRTTTIPRYPAIRGIDGNRRTYTMPYPDEYDPANEFYMNKWRLGSKPRYYDGNGSASNENANSSGMRNIESGYDRAKRYYMDTKNSHTGNSAEDKNAKMMSLEDYMKEISDDITEMIQGASSEEKANFKSKLTTLAGKI